MREEALVPAKLDNPDLKVVDVGGGTGFCTLGVIKAGELSPVPSVHGGRTSALTAATAATPPGIKPENVTLIDQSPHQLEKARQKEQLRGVTILEGDAEALPFATDSFDRYVSAGSIE